MRSPVVALAALTALLNAAPAFAQAKEPSGKYLDVVKKGEKAFVAGDTPGAIAAFQEAIKMDDAQMLAFYRLGEAQLKDGKVDDADRSWQTANGKMGSPSLHGKVLFVIADLRERQGKWDLAKEAWTSYEKFLQSNPKAHGYPGSAAERKKQIARRVKDEKDYGAVKERIAKREVEKTKEAEDNAKNDKLNK